jgi:hypothetical protein
MSEEFDTDVTEMYGIHDCLRHEFARLPLTVKATAEGDSRRAGVLGRHTLLMTRVLHAHHEGEDLLVWPLLEERAPEHGEIVTVMEEQHERMQAAVATASEQATAWMENPGVQERAALHTTLIALEREVLHHLALEEQEVLPLIRRHLSQEEWAAVGAHARGTLSDEELPVVLGLIVHDTSQARGEAILGGMPPEARAGFEQFGRPLYDAYAAALADY